MSDNGSSRPVSPVSGPPDIQNSPIQRLPLDSIPRKAGPGSIFSETTEGHGDYYASTVHLPFNFSSTSLALPTVPQDWSSAKHGFHAISTVVNSPHKRSAPPKAHSSIAAVTPITLPRPNRKILNQYVQGISPEWERFQKSGQLGVESAGQVEGPLSSFDLPRSPRPSTSKHLPPLHTIPSVFFNPQFDLGDPSVFNIVTEQGEEQSTLLSLSLSHSLPLLEKLSHYADTIEQHLVREISLRSTSFFAALSNLQDLQTESEQCIERISQLKTMLNEVDDKNAKPGLGIVRMESKLRNLESVKEGVRLISSVVEMTGVAKGLAAAGQWGEALEVVEELQALWDRESTSSTLSTAGNGLSLPPVREVSEGRSTPVRDSSVTEGISAPTTSTASKLANGVPLHSLHVFSGLPSHLQALTMEIATSLTTELVNVLRIDLVERTAGSAMHEQQSQTLKDRLRPLLQGLLRARGLREAASAWRETVLAEVRSCIKLHLPHFSMDDDGATSINHLSINPASHLQSLTHPDFITLIRSVYTSLLNCVEGVQIENKIFIEVLDALQSPIPPVDLPALQEELFDILSSAAELSHECASKVVSFRSEQHTVLPLPDFLHLFNDTWNFVLKCEVICRRMIVGLRGVIVSQAKTFLQAFHQDRISQSAKLVEDEQWSPAEVPPHFQQVIQTLIDSAVRDPPELLLEPPSVLASPSPPKLKKVPVSPSRISKHVRIDDRSYFAVSATLEALDLLVDYSRVIINLPMLTTDTMNKVIEFFKSFNSRTCQVVLGAGAMRSAGLKNITAKHLALASQSLSIMISLIPYVRESFRRQLSEKQAIMLIEFDKLKRDFQEHQNEIHAKLVAIMGDRLTAHIRSLQTVNWDMPPAQQGVNDYMELLVKETVTLHKVLSRYLSITIVESVMSQVFAAINHSLAVEYGNIELPDQDAKNRLLADAQYLHEKLSALNNVSGASTGMLMTIVSERPTVNQPSRTNPSQRIKGMLSRQTTRATEKGLPSAPPSPSSQSASPVPLRSPQSSLEMNGSGTILANPRSPSLPTPTGGENAQVVPDPVDKHENGNGIAPQWTPHVS